MDLKEHGGGGGGGLFCVAVTKSSACVCMHTRSNAAWVAVPVVHPDRVLLVGEHVLAGDVWGEAHLRNVSSFSFLFFLFFFLLD